MSSETSASTIDSSITSLRQVVNTLQTRLGDTASDEICALYSELDRLSATHTHTPDSHHISTSTNQTDSADDNINILLKQNARLENAIHSLSEELNDVTNGIIRRGHLFKWRDRMISFASNWGLRYFVLQGSVLSYFGDENDRHPRKTIDLSDCIVLDEGITKNGKHHIFSVCLKSAIDISRGPQSGALLRLSSDNEAEAQQWITMLDKACGAHPKKTGGFGKAPSNHLSTSMSDSNIGYDIDGPGSPSMPPPVLARVQSSNRVLQNLQNRDDPTLSSLRKPTSNVYKPATKDKKSRPTGKSFSASKSIHVRSQPSPLSINAKQQNYRGFFNLGVIILFVSHFRVIFDNIVEYGLYMSYFTSRDTPAATGGWALPQPLLVVATWGLILLLTFGVEKLAQKGFFSDRTAFVVQFLLSLGNICGSCLWVWFSKSHPALCMLYLMQSVILWMKMISYAHCNRDVRIAHREAKAADRIQSDPSAADNNAKPLVNIHAEMQDITGPVVTYPQNLTIPNLLYFCVAPTLCYQLNYPRSPCIRWRYLLTLLMRIVITSGMILFVVNQHMTPALEAAMQPMHDLDILSVIQRLVHIMIPNTYVWLLGFYLFFHLWLNLLAEITRFGDREFYKDWWNARTIDEYWRTWNLPVHHWMCRHLYYPLLRQGASKQIAVYAAFFFSAAFHELIISIPFRRISCHAFLGMLMQAPLVTVTRKVNAAFNNQIIGNVFFWLTFCMIGQPVGVILYYYENWSDVQR